MKLCSKMENFTTPTCFVFVFVFISFTSNPVYLTSALSSVNSSCGLDKSPMTRVYQGWARIEHYPWMGYLSYPYKQNLLTTTVILVTKQLVIATASEIDQLPKNNFRKNARVVLGGNCSGPSLKILEYTFHPEYRRSSYYELAVIQLDVDQSGLELRPICPPPTHFIDPEFYAMSFGTDCSDSKIRVHRMSHVEMKECKMYYRRAGLNAYSMWPRYTACARTLDRVSCVWRSGTALVMRQRGRWLLLGFGVYGPGCSAPARFVDYGMYHDWVKTNVARIGRPAITRVDPSHLILRRKTSHVQRFGACDEEELYDEIYTDYTNVTARAENRNDHSRFSVMIYNVTLFTNMEYSCVVFRVRNTITDQDPQPRLHLRRWCAGPRAMCHDFQHLQIDFYVEIIFAYDAIFTMRAYGREPQVIDPQTTMEFVNHYTRKYPQIANKTAFKKPSPLLIGEDFKWFKPK